MVPRTPRGETRARILAFVKERILEGCPPTVREVQTSFGFRSVQTAREHLEKLVAEGALEKRSGVARGYGLPEVAAARPSMAVPILGAVQAGNPVLAMEEPEGTINVVRRPACQELFALKVRGYSMKDAGILPGDVVVVRRQQVASDGDLVVALIDDEATVKRFRRVKGKPQLHPENDEFLPIIPRPGEELRILGQVVEVRRYLDGLH